MVLNRAALRTNFVVSNKIMLDAGLSCPMGVDYIFLTHGHSDHMASIYYNTLTPVAVGKKRLIYVPAEIKDRIDTYLQVSYEVGAASPGIFDESALTYETIGVMSGEEIDITHNGKPYRVVVFDNDHSVPCRSFGFDEHVKSLKDMYRGLEGRDLGALRKQGVQIEEYRHVPRFVYIGNSQCVLQHLHYWNSLQLCC